MEAGFILLRVVSLSAPVERGQRPPLPRTFNEFYRCSAVHVLVTYQVQVAQTNDVLTPLDDAASVRRI